MLPLISVVVPNYNHSAYLKKRLDSIFNQTYTQFEVILLDDASTDNSVDILSHYAAHPKVTHIIVNKENSGSTFKQWNKGIGLVKGDLIWIAESDDFCENDFLEKMVHLYNLDQEISMFFCQSHRLNAKGIVTGNWLSHTNNYKLNVFHQDFVMDGNLFIEKYLIHKNVIPNVSAILFRKATLKKILPLKFDSHMKYNADWFYYVQLLCNSKVGYVSNSLNYFRYHESSVIGNASNEKSGLSRLKMDLCTRKKMITYLKSRNVVNLERIKFQKKIGDANLRFRTVNEYIKGKKIMMGIWIALEEPKIWKKTFSLLRH